ncbi:MAG: hypothetical protein Q9203_000557 [Teloschistes exilis]
MAKPTKPSQVRVKPRQVMRQNVITSVTTMLAAIDRKLLAESETYTNDNERIPQQCDASSYQDDPKVAEYTEPVQFTRRLVLRQRVPVRTIPFVQMQKSYRLAQRHINKFLTDYVEFERKEKAICGTGLSLLSEEDYVLLRCALREKRFRADLQIKGLVHLEAQELALLEQAWKEQGGPNESERIFLRNVSWRIDSKDHQQRAIRAIIRKMISGLDDRNIFLEMEERRE